MSSKGKRWGTEWSTFKDPISGTTVHQLTRYRGDSSHFYFTHPGWYDGGRKLFLNSNREGRTNLFCLDLRSHELTQVTDQGCWGICANPARPEAIVKQERTFLAVDPETLEQRPIYVQERGFHGHDASVTADGKYMCMHLVSNMSAQVREAMSRGATSRRRVMWELHPPTKILKVAMDGSGVSTILYQEEAWLAHVNASPTRPDLLTFSHTGPGRWVENGIRVLDVETGRAWTMRPDAPEGPAGHEYWMADGEHIGYHVKPPEGPRHGSIRYDNTERREAPIAPEAMHVSSLCLDLLVGDGLAPTRKSNPYLLLWRLRDGHFQGPKVLAWHGGSARRQELHVHPLFSPDGKYVLYTADPHGYGQVYLAEVPDFDDLPDLGTLA